jgi:osmotically-inducible protein OsmY
MKIIRAVLTVSIMYQLAACDAHSGVDPVVAQEIALARTDPDAALAEKVERALGDIAPLALGIDVTAENGRVELWGTVESEATRKRMEILAAGVVGVKALTSRLRVDPNI